VAKLLLMLSNTTTHLLNTQNILNTFFYKKEKLGLLYFKSVVNTRLFTLLLCLPVTLCAQFDTDYSPIILTGEIPSRFYINMSGETEIKIVLKEENFGRKRQKAFETTTRFTLRDIFLSGSIYYNDPCTPYVREVADKLLAEVSTTSEISVFVSRFSTPNAAIWQDGTLIINIGLLARLENEAQLAFVLAHEIGHYQKRHPFHQYVRQQKPDNIQKRALDNLKANAAYTQQREEEADAFALELLDRVGYDSHEGQKALDLILHDATHDYCPSKWLPINETNLCEELEVHTYINMERSAANHFAPVMLKKRKKKIQNIPTSQEALYLASEDDFQMIKRVAEFEIIENSYHEADYVATLCYATALQQKYPNNIYLRGKIAESLFQLYFYKKRGTIDQILKLNRENNSEEDILRLSCYMNKANEKVLQELTGDYLDEQYENWRKKDETIAITMAKYVALAFGTEQAKSYFQHCVQYFPEGKHYRYAEAQCE